MSIEVEIQKKAWKTDSRQIRSPEDVYNLKEVQEIKDAMQEHFLFIGLDRANHITKLSLMGIGTGGYISIDSKHLIRTALVNACEKVIFVHNHPSNSLNPSKEDNHLTNVTKKLMSVFNIELTDHIIVTEENYVSMEGLKAKDNSYCEDYLEYIDNALLKEENEELKKKIETLTMKLEDKEQVEEDEEEI